MKLLYFGNNKVGLEALRWLLNRGEEVCGLVVHPETRAQYREEMIELAGLRETSVFAGSMLQEPTVLQAIQELKADLGLSVFFGYLLRKELLDLLPNGCLNLHPGLLPYNRGAHPNIWSLVEGTPAGVTLHYMDEQVDTGAILAQKTVAVDPTDTGQSLYGKLESACLDLLQESWADLSAGLLEPRPQTKEAGTFHRVKDLEGLDPIDLDRTYRAGDLINLLRARTFPPYNGAYFLHEGRKVFLRLQLIPEEEPCLTP